MRKRTEKRTEKKRNRERKTKSKKIMRKKTHIGVEVRIILAQKY